jgi:2'-5' RNA ligase
MDDSDRAMRLFTGISIPSPVLGNLELAMARLRPLANVNWSPAANLHLTTKFIGQWPENRLDELTSTLASMATPAPFPLTIADFGFFPGGKAPRVLFAGVNAGPELADLAQRTSATLAALGCPPEKRNYSAHLTLARITNENIGQLRAYILSMQNNVFGSFDVTEFHLYLSKPSGRGSVYTKLASFPLGAGKC